MGRINILSRLKNRLFGESYYDLSYAQEGEDMILRRVFNPDIQSSGFYVDIGAHHPKRFSNTYYFYKRGWRGINIDAMPGSMEPFNAMRPRDVNLEVAISNSASELVYYSFNEPALNGFSKELSENRASLGDIYYVKEEIILKTYRLADILADHLPVDTDIDFFSIDVEGLDYEVLQSNDWARFRPKMILAEALVKPTVDVQTSEIVPFLKDRGYSFFAKTVNTVFFRRDDF
tara:strand:+ start:916 stop:1611 length:696 start_codon:yes stop_codon:yes gene_type:complete